MGPRWYKTGDCKTHSSPGTSYVKRRKHVYDINGCRDIAGWSAVLYGVMTWRLVSICLPVVLIEKS